MHLVKNPHNPPERYNEVEPLRTYIETSAFTIYGHGPIGINPFAHLFKTIGFQSTIAFIKPWHWERLIDAYPNKQHILLLRNPQEQHWHGAYLHAVSANQSMQKRNNLFYNTHLQPYLPVIEECSFDFYIPLEELNKFCPDYISPSKPPYEETGKVQLFDLKREINTYERIKENKMKLEVSHFRELIIHGQLQEI